MKTATVAVLAVFAVLFAVTTFFESPRAVERARRHFTDEQIAAGREHSFQRRMLFWSAQAVVLVFLGWAALGGWGRTLADTFDAQTGGRWWATLLLVGAVLFAAQTVLTFPASAVAGWAVPRSWGLTDRSFPSWLGDYGKGLALSAVFGAVVVVGLYLLMRLMPRLWPAAAAGGAVVLGMTVAFLMPLIIAPLFNEFTPIAKTKWAHLEPRIAVLTKRAGVQVGEVLVADASRQGRHTNAYFTGFGPTRRIVLYDTLLDSHSPEEVESVLAHEIGHWMHNHIAKGILLGAAGSLIGLFALSWLLGWAVGREPFLLKSPADPAGLPLVMLAGFLAGWIAMPIEHAISRHFERQADAAALDLAGDPEVFIEAEKRLAADNISNVAPNPFAVWLFSTHPPAVERIEMAEQRLPPERRAPEPAAP